MPLLRTVPEVRQPQRTAVQGRRPVAAGANARRRATRPHPWGRRSDRDCCAVEAMTMLAFAKKTALAGIACLRRPRGERGRAAEAPPSQAIVGEGPGGRIALTRWTLRADPSARGLALGWQRGGFGGASVSVPNVVDPTRYAGAAAQANYEGSVAWYRTTFTAAAAGTYALSFQSANFSRAGVGGRARARLTPGLLPAVRTARAARRRQAHGGRARRLARPRPRSRASAFTAPGSTGAGSTARSACARSARASCRARRSRRRSRPARSTAFAPPVPTSRPCRARPCGSACRCATTAPPGARSRPRARSCTDRRRSR